MRVCFCSYFTGENRPAYHGWSIILSGVQPKYMLNLTQQKCHWPLVISEAWADDFFRPPTKSREGNVFSRFCLSLCSQGRGCPCTGLRLQTSVQGSDSSPPPLTGPWPWPHSLYRVPCPRIKGPTSGLHSDVFKSGRLAFDWNAFLFQISLVLHTNVLFRANTIVKVTSVKQMSSS